MKNNMFDDQVQVWEQAAVRRIARKLGGRWQHSKLEVADLEQEGLIRWLALRCKFDPDRGADIKTFLVKVVEGQLGHMLERMSADKRKASIVASSLDQPREGAEDVATLKEAVVDDRNFAREVDLKIDITVLLQEVSPRQRALCCLLLDGHTMKEVSDKLNISKGVVYDEINRMEHVARKLGLHGYFE